MQQLNGQLYQKISYMLEKPAYALLMTGVLALFPFTGWLSLAVMALVTLRLNWIEGVRCLIVGLTVSICLAEYAGLLSETLTTTVPTYLLCYACAYILRRTTSWQIVASFSVVLAVFTITDVHFFAVNFLIDQYNSLLAMISAIDQEKLITQVFATKNQANQLKFAHYLFGIKVLSVVFSTMVPLMMARSIQSTLYYPGAFKLEMINFRASSLGFILLTLCVLGAYQNNLLALSCLPLLFVYLMMAGVSLILNFLVNKKKLVIYASLFLPMVILPYVVLPIYVVFGSIDSLFNLRSRVRRS